MAALGADCIGIGGVAVTVALALKLDREGRSYTQGIMRCHVDRGSGIDIEAAIPSGGLEHSRRFEVERNIQPRHPPATVRAVPNRRRSDDVQVHPTT